MKRVFWFRTLVFFLFLNGDEPRSIFFSRYNIQTSQRGGCTRNCGKSQRKIVDRKRTYLYRPPSKRDCTSNQKLQMKEPKNY